MVAILSIMDRQRLLKILNETTAIGDAPEGYQPVLPEIMSVSVNRDSAEACLGELRAILECYPRPENLAAGPSYIEVGNVIGTPDDALRLFALGKVLGLWDIVTPAKWELTGREAELAAHAGFIMISGFQGRRRSGAIHTAG